MLLIVGRPCVEYRCGDRKPDFWEETPPASFSKSAAAARGTTPSEERSAQDIPNHVASVHRPFMSVSLCSVGPDVPMVKDLPEPD